MKEFFFVTSNPALNSTCSNFVNGAFSDKNFLMSNKGETLEIANFKKVKG